MRRKSDWAGAMRRGFAVLGAACVIAGVPVVAVGATPSTLPHRAFYLDLKAGQCARGPFSKMLLVVSCSDGRHAVEVFAVLHGGWAHGSEPSHSGAFAIAQQKCTATFQRRFGHPIAFGYGWYAFWPDRGAEAAKYGDRIVCMLTRYPHRVPMGPGTHFKQ